MSRARYAGPGWSWSITGSPALRAECRLCGYAGPFDADDVEGGW